MTKSPKQKHRLGKTSTLLALTLLVTNCVLNLPAYANAESEITQTGSGDIVLSRQAAQDFLREWRELRAENTVLRESLEAERAATQELINAVGELREQVQKERAASQETIAAFKDAAAEANKAFS